ncbi:hypothetical protein GOODEAATRI_018462, partial [Goodea atripinnis]
YHVLNNMNHSDKTQVPELLEKIEEMWAGNKDPYYEVDLDRAAQIEAKKEAGDKMARRLKKINERQSRVLKELNGGPHVFLLVVPISRAFTEKDLKALVEILRPLTERVWRHCMVLFTWGDWLNGLPVENYIAREGKELQELLEKCGNRYHVLNPIQISGSIEVKKLLQKLIDMVTQNKGCFTTEDKQKKFQVQPWQKQLIEEEWNRRAQELVERILKVLAKEPEEPTVPSKRMTNSMNEFYIPDSKFTLN